MNVEWKVLEEEGEAFQSEPEEPPLREEQRSWRPWLLRLLLLLLALLLGAGAISWRVRQQTLRLRAELSAVVEAETRAQAFGLGEEGERLVDLAAPQAWKSAYGELFSPKPDMPDWLLPGVNWQWTLPSVKPQVRDVVLSGDGNYVDVWVEWQERSHLLEQRRYRLVEGRWRRTPRLGPDGQPAVAFSTSDYSPAPPLPDGWERHQSEHVVLHGSPSDIQALTTEPLLLMDLEGFLDHFIESWPEPFAGGELLTEVAVWPVELSPIMVLPNQESVLVINSPNFALTYPKNPLSPEAQYRVALLSQLAARRVLGGIRELYSEPTQTFEENFFFLLLLGYLLPEFEAYEWTLEPTERDALRAAWREELASEWRSPFADPRAAFEGNSEPRAFEPWVLSWFLLIDQLLAEGTIDSPGHLARLLVEEPARPFPELLVEVTGLEQEALEAHLRAYALPQP